MKQSLSIMALLAATATAQTGEYLINTTETVAAGTYMHYLGYARGGRFVVDNSGCSTSVTFRLAYATRGLDYSCPWIDSTVGCVTNVTDAVANVSQCVAVTRTNTAKCAGVGTITAQNSSDYVPGGDSLYTYSPSGSTSQDYKAVGTGQYQWFLEYVVGADISTGCDLILTSGKAYSPENGYCTTQNDTEWQGDTVDYFATGADLPRHIGDNYKISTQIVGSDTSDLALTTLDASVVYGFFDLGFGPTIALSCIQLYVTPSVAAAAGCTDIQVGYDATVAPFSDTFGFDLISAPDCRSSPVSAACCVLDSKASCQALTGCSWFSFGYNGECYLTSDLTTIDIKSGGVIGKTQQEYTFDSIKTRTSTSSYVTRPLELEQGWDPVSTRRWFFRYENKALPTAVSTTCPVAVTVSSISHTTGGICEPSSRALCDGVEETCFATDLYKYPRYWRQNEPDATLKDVLEKSEYKTCNCLKQKEICYRKNGCLSSKRYELILQNCLEAGCGDFCNSSGSVMGLNLAALLVAVIALMF